MIYYNPQIQVGSISSPTNPLDKPFFFSWLNWTCFFFSGFFSKAIHQLGPFGCNEVHVVRGSGETSQKVVHFFHPAQKGGGDTVDGSEIPNNPPGMY